MPHYKEANTAYHKTGTQMESSGQKGEGRETPGAEKWKQQRQKQDVDLNT